MGPLSPIAWLLLGGAVFTRIGFIVQQPPKLREALLGLPVLFTVVIIGYGVVFAVHVGHADAAWRELVCPLLILLQIGASFCLVWRYMQGIRVPATFLLLFELCFSLMAGFEATMDVTNKWI
ncbi:hypothetical protein [Bremerella sp.]|uniref:hypothetical protein n=1 Tax=Bremerella sp. TaxID=2795602 RepID=UPI00391D01C0